MNKQVDVLPGINLILDDARRKIETLTGTKVNITISEAPSELSEDTLQYLVCREFTVSWKNIVSLDRNRKYVDARSVYCYLAHYVMGKSKVMLGLQLNRHHSSIIHLITRAKNMCETKDQTIAPALAKIEKIIRRSYESVED